MSVELFDPVIPICFDKTGNNNTFPASTFFREAPFDLVSVGDFHAVDGIGGAYPGDGTLVAVDAEVVHDLQVEGTIPERGTPFHAFGTAYTEILIDDIFEIGLFDELAGDGRSGTQLVFTARIEVVAPGLEIAAAEIAIPTEVVSMNAFDSRGGQDTVGGAPSALGTRKGIDLPDPFLPGHTGRSQSADTP